MGKSLRDGGTQQSGAPKIVDLFTIMPDIGQVLPVWNGAIVNISAALAWKRPRLPSELIQSHRGAHALTSIVSRVD